MTLFEDFDVPGRRRNGGRPDASSTTAREQTTGDIRRSCPDDADRLRGLCHDLRQYVAAGLLLSETSSDQALDPAIAERLEFIHQTLLRAEEMIDTTQREFGARIREFELAPIVEQSVALLARTSGVRIDTEVSSSPVALGDPGLVRRAVVNVLDNAARAVGQGGSILARTGADDGNAWFEVVDDGRGFGQIVSGTGFGLAMVHAAIEASDGHLQISSSRRGTTVRIVLPARDAMADG
jgi:signal transduction histidine kinase